MNRFVEVIVNVPIRRSFSRRQSEPPPFDQTATGPGENTLDDPSDSWWIADYHTFHYHIPPALEGQIRAGHLVWVPFGRKKVQGVVASLAETSPVTTKPILQLARPTPVLTPIQLELATWIAHRYITPPSEAVKLFLPPGLLSKDPEATGVQAKHELWVELLADHPSSESALEQRLLDAGRSNQQAAVLAYLLSHSPPCSTVSQIRAGCDLRNAQAIHALQRKGMVEIGEGQEVALATTAEVARERLFELRGVAKHRKVLQALAAAGGALWRSELYERVEADLTVLRELQAAGLVRLADRVHYRDPLAGRSYAPTITPMLTNQQADVWETIYQSVFAGDPEGMRPAQFLLHGVTGSGKTEVYLRAIAETLARGRQAIVLVPEIALTPQTVARFAGRFPDRVTVVHSALSRGERYDVWRRLREGEYDVVVGPRSALFAPLPRLGLIVIDEEHESSYKQNAEEWGSFTVFYDARAVAQRLAELTQSALILGSATPSLEAYHGAVQGELKLLELPRRVLGRLAPVEPSHPQPDGPGAGEASAPVAAAQFPVGPVLYAEMPPVEVVDMRQELRAGNRSILSRSLQAELHATLDAGAQAILFINRRGTSTFVMCRDCGHVQSCPLCDVPLTYHERVNVLICHHCNRRYPIPDICPQCGSRRIKYFGTGTQRIEELVAQISPRARLLRWDADTTTHKGSHEAILERFAAHEADVLVGTQMIAKGLDLPLVTLVGVVSADVGLYLPDFRSAERTFQLLTQVAGRAGRSERGGRVVIQTYNPRHYTIQAAAQHDYRSFYERESAFRREHSYPPHRRIIRLIYWEKNAEKVQTQTEQMARTLRQRQQELGILGQFIEVIGPAPAFFARYRGFHRWQILVKAPDPALLLRGLAIPFGWRVDVDPVSLL